MIHKKTLKAGQVTKIAQVGQFIKVMNCENRFTIQATRQGKEVVFSEAAAGFDLAAVEPFDELTIQSETEQKLEIWVSKHKLSYDALSTKPSRSSSFIVEHFGQSQQLLPYDPAQSSAKISSSGAGFWVGGEGVTNETGIFCPQGSVYEHNSAAPIYAFVNGFPNRIFDPQSVSYLNAPQSPIGYGLGALNAGKSLKEDGNNFHIIITDLQDGSSVDLGKLLGTTGSYKPFKNGFMCLYSGHSLKVVYADNTVATYGNQLDRTGFSPRCCVEGSDGAFVLGQPDQGVNNKIYYLRDGAWQLATCPQALIDKAIFHAFRDTVDGSIWLVTSGNEVYVSTDNLESVTLIQNLSVDYGKELSMSFSADKAMIAADGLCKVIDRQSLGFVELEGKAPEIKGGALLGEQWLIVSSNKVYSSVDGFDTYNEAYTNDVNFVPVSQVIYEYGNKVYLESPAAQGVDIISAELVIDVSKPVEKIRVFKESL